MQDNDKESSTNKQEISSPSPKPAAPKPIPANLTADSIVARIEKEESPRRGDLLAAAQKLKNQTEESAKLKFLIETQKRVDSSTIEANIAALDKVILELDSIDPTAYNEKQLATIITLREDLSKDYSRVNSDEQDQFNKRATDAYRKRKGSGDIRGLGNLKATIRKLDSLANKIKAARKVGKKVKVTFTKPNHSDIDRCLIVLSVLIKVALPIFMVKEDNLFGVKTKGH